MAAPLIHFMHKRLKATCQILALAKFQLRTGQTHELQATLDRIQEDMRALWKHLEKEDRSQSVLLE
jgi:hypothetical protein